MDYLKASSFKNTDDDDFVDACYTIEKFKRYTDHNCAGGNARVNMEHFFVQSN